jgi:glutaryl-CoA dehydrogenase
MPADADFYSLELLLDDQDRALLHRVRDDMEGVQPIINRYWIRAKFPSELLPAWPSQLRRPDRDLGQGRRGRPGQGLRGRGRVTREMNTLIVGRAITGLSAFT